MRSFGDALHALKRRTSSRMTGLIVAVISGFATTLIVNRKQHVFAAGALASLRMRRVVYVRLRSLFQGRPVRNVVE